MNADQMHELEMRVFALAVEVAVIGRRQAACLAELDCLAAEIGLAWDGASWSPVHG